ncbi:MAG: tetratricopeptide repeat protein [Armatimonadota bacterium]
MVCMRCEHPVGEGAHYCSHCGAPVEHVDVPNWRRDRAERLLREALSLSEQGRYEEALLACEGALALEPEMLPALSLKALLHEKRGQIEQAIEAYQRVVQLNPLSVSERARLEALRRQPRAIVRMQAPAPRPLWVEALPAVLAFIGAGVVLVVGLVAILRLSAPSAPSASPAPPASESASAPSSAVQPSSPSPMPAQPEATSPAVPPVMVDPSRLALAPIPPPRGAIPPAPAPSEKPPLSGKPDQVSKPNSSSAEQGNLMPDVEVRESQSQGVYEIYVHKGEASEVAPPTREAAPPPEDPLEIARRHQMAGNYREAIEAYQQALPTAPSQGDVHQQIAICYLRLNDKANARLHFQQAIQAYQLQIQRGQDVPAAQEGIRACEQGLKLCD